MQDELTAGQKLLLAAHALTAAKRSPFTIEDLSVESWKQDPKAFGLKGYEHPNSNVVYAEVYHARGPVKAGYLKKEGAKLFSLAPDGTAEAERILHARPGEPVRRHLRPGLVPKATAVRLDGLLRCRAWHRFAEANPAEINWPDAQAFLGFEPGPTLEEAERYVVNGEVTLPGGQVVSGRTLARLLACWSFLVGTFSREIEKQRRGAFRRLG